MASDASVNEAKAAALVADAEKKLAPSTFSFFSSKSGKQQDAAELYDKAGNFYKLAKNFAKAGEVYALAAQCQLNADSRHEAASFYVKSAQSFKQGQHFNKCEQSLTQAITLFSEEGRFNMAAKNQKELAELYETERMLPQALEAFNRAAELYEGEGSPAAANGCTLKAADIAAAQKDFKQAIAGFEKVAQSSVGNKMLQWSVKDYLLKAGICRLAEGDLVAMKKALDQYVSMSEGFVKTRECQLLQALTDAAENLDSDGFSAALAEFDKFSPLDAWKTAVLLDVKEKLDKADDAPDFT